MGGVASLFAGKKAGKALSDASDKGGWLSNMGAGIGKGAESAWNALKKGASDAGSWIADKWGGVSDWFGTNVWTPVSGAAQATASWLNDRWGEVNSWVQEKWGVFSSWFDETVWTPVKGAAQTAGAWLGEQFTAAKTAISEAWGSVSGWFESNVWGPIKGGASAAWDWAGDKLNGIGEWIGGEWKSFTDWLGKMGAKGSKETGLTTSTGKGSVFEHAYGGIMTKPHMGIVAEEGAEGIIPLSPSKRRRGIDLWQRTGELLGVRPYEEGGIVGDTPVAASTGGSGRSGEGGNLTVNNQIEPNITFNISTGADPKEVVETIRAKSSEIADILADDVAGATTDRLKKVYANMPRKAFAY